MFTRNGLILKEYKVIDNFPTMNIPNIIHRLSLGLKHEYLLPRNVPKSELRRCMESDIEWPRGYHRLQISTLNH